MLLSIRNYQQHIIEEAKIIVGNPVIIPNKPSGSIELANTVLKAFEGERKKEENGDEQVRAVIIRNHGVVSIGNNIYQARAVIESLEEWAKIYTIPKIFDGPKYVL
ncbi:MAG TPA: class II aldolase/adducin family protein [Nitrososphaeraceae archaeon]|nr:class II aldolase/adducin family protein [Nitrososphaeraceae archaeon]